MAESPIVAALRTVPPDIDLKDNASAGILAAVIVTFALAVISTVLRLVSRRYISDSGFWLDDVMILVSLIFTTACFVIMILAIRDGMGRHVWLFGVAGYEANLRWFFVFEFVYPLSLLSTKASIIMFYWRIFGIRRSLRIIAISLLVIVVAWATATILLTGLQCTPIEAAWSATVPVSNCSVGRLGYAVGVTAPNVLLDWILLFLPVPYIWRLKCGLSQRLAFVLVFMSGGFASIASVVRLHYLLISYSTPTVDVTWQHVPLGIWTACELNGGVLSANLPSLRPLLNVVLGKRAREDTSRTMAGRRHFGADGQPQHHQEDVVITWIEVVVQQDLEETEKSNFTNTGRLETVR